MVHSKVAKYRLDTWEKVNKPGLHRSCLDDITVWVNSQFFRHGDETKNADFLSQVNSLTDCGPQVDTWILQEAQVSNLLTLAEEYSQRYAKQTAHRSL